jgi:uridine kinase
MTKPFILAIAGGSGSGKTFLAEAIHKSLGEDTSSILSQDNYYFDQSAKFDHDGGSVNFDHPEAIDFLLLAAHLNTLKKGENINVPFYDFATHSRSESQVVQEPKKIIIVDGILILTEPKLREEFDEIIFVSTPEETRYERRLKRDVTERGRTPDGVKAQFDAQVKPMHDEFVEPSQCHAHRISSGTVMSSFEETLSYIVKKINS